jgi:chorismate--pyruvate lyase
MIKMNEQHSLFPVKMYANWQAANCCDVNEHLQDWLLDPSSLTARLKRHSENFRVQLLGQKIENCCANEANEDILVGQQVLVREVVLFCDEQPQVFARSLLPLSSLTGDEKKLAKLGSQSLGQVLFNNPKLQRKRIEVSSFDSSSSIFSLVKYFQLPSRQMLWGRRSVFVLDDKPLMVAEVFLPNAHAYQKQG